MEKQFWVVEGVDFAGKSTALDYLKTRVNAEFLAPKIKSPTDNYEDRFYFFLNFNIEEQSLIEKHLNSGSVILDRYVTSTLAYHNIKAIEEKKPKFHEREDVIQKLSEIKKPDLTLFITASYEEIVSRMKIRGASHSWESDAEYLFQVQSEFKDLISTGAFSRYAITIDTSDTIEETREKLEDLVIPLLS